MNSKYLKNFTWITALICCLSFSSLAKGEIYLSISKKYREKIKIGISFAALANSKLPAEQVSAILAQDLIFSGSFSVPPNLIIDNDNPALNTWLKMGAEVLVKGTITTTSDSLELSAKLTSVSTGTEIFAKQYTTKTNNLRRVIHVMADEIVFNLTGEKGIAKSKITFTSEKAGHKNIYIMDYDGNRPKKITLNQSTNLFPAYSPDGKFIFFTSYLEGPPYLYSLSQEGKISLVSKYPGLNSLAKVNKDNQLALVLSKDGNPEIYTMNMYGSSLRRLTKNKSIDTSPSWSPDGKKLAFVSNRSGSPQLYILNVKNKQTERITFQGSYNSYPAWSPKGNLIAFSSMTKGKFQICTLEVETGEIKQLTNNPYNNENPSWAPNGLTLVYSASRKGQSFLNLIDIYEKQPRPITSSEKHGNCSNPCWSF